MTNILKGHFVFSKSCLAALLVFAQVRRRRRPSTEEDEGRRGRKEGKRTTTADRVRKNRRKRKERPKGKREKKAPSLKSSLLNLHFPHNRACVGVTQSANYKRTKMHFNGLFCMIEDFSTDFQIFFMVKIRSINYIIQVILGFSLLYVRFLCNKYFFCLQVFVSVFIP